MNSVLINIKFDNNFGDFIHPLILLVPRSSLYISIISYIHETIFKNKFIEDNKNIKLTFKNLLIKINR